eukprot:4068750-Pyramimonas_sp.AAC.1
MTGLTTAYGWITRQHNFSNRDPLEVWTLRWGQLIWSMFCLSDGPRAREGPPEAGTSEIWRACHENPFGPRVSTCKVSMMGSEQIRSEYRATPQR